MRPRLRASVRNVMMRHMAIDLFLYRFLLAQSQMRQAISSNVVDR
jgi:hypothetical protein